MNKRNKEIINKFKQDPLKNTMSKLSEEFGITKARIWSILSENGVEIHQVSKEARKKRNQEIYEKHLNGVSYEELSKEYELVPKTIKIIVRDLSPEKESIQELVVKDVKNNPGKHSLKSLSLKYDVSTNSIERYLTSSGIDLGLLKEFVRDETTKNIPYPKEHEKMLKEIEKTKGKYTIKQLSEMYNISQPHLTRILSHEGLQVSKKQVTMAQKEPLLRDLKENPGKYFIKDLSKNYNVGYLSVSRWIKEANLNDCLKERY